MVGTRPRSLGQGDRHLVPGLRSQHSTYFETALFQDVHAFSFKAEKPVPWRRRRLA